jgi:CHAT domain
MIYTHPVPGEKLGPDGRNFRPEGFWGIRHILEHKTERVKTPVMLRADGSGKIPTGVGYGERLDATLIEGHRRFFRGLDTSRYAELLSLEELRRTLQSTDFENQFLYFFCHGLGEGDMDSPTLGEAGIALADGQLITAYCLDQWFEDGIPSRPLVFINACQGGHLTTLFYETLALRLLQKDALALLGSQVDLPALFAAEFAQRLMGEFLASPSPDQARRGSPRLGDLVRNLTRQFLFDHRNPLGLAYTLYRGMDCYVEWGASGRSR